MSLVFLRELSSAVGGRLAQGRGGAPLLASACSRRASVDGESTGYPYGLRVGCAIFGMAQNPVHTPYSIPYQVPYGPSRVKAQATGTGTRFELIPVQ